MSDERVLIRAGRLIDVERSEVLTDRVIVVEGDRIADVLTERRPSRRPPRSICPVTPCSPA